MPEVKAKKNANAVLVTRLAVGTSILTAALTAADRLLPLNIRGNAYLDMFLTSLGALAYTIFLVLLPFLAFFVFRALLRLARGERTADLAYWLPLLVEALTVAVFFLIPTKVGYAANRRAYHEVVALAGKGRLSRRTGGEIPLPAAYRGLTTTGTILLAKRDGIMVIYFPLQRRQGQFGRFLVYAADDRDPVGEAERAAQKPRVVVRKLEKCWYDAIVY
ncbi:MAG: hypothetical protein ACM3XS_05110 [Bacteroidota bacterium]